MAHYLITGHTGFKGAWLIFLLKARGHEVSGLALDPLPGSLFERADLAQDLTHDFRVDIRDREKTHKAFQEVQPDYVIHMAAQALVREGYRNPLLTYETNVSGTLNVLQAIEESNSVRAQLMVTTDKVYLNQGLGRPYIETDPLGGKDPYSASKAMADILAQEWISRNGAKLGAVARAGNVIGVGDNSQERLIPDILRAETEGTTLQIRFPFAVRPWQHVLDCLNGYLRLVDHLVLEGSGGCWNFGPDDFRGSTVMDVINLATELGRSFDYETLPQRTEWNEEQTLLLDSFKSRARLDWEPKLTEKEAVTWALAQPIGSEKGEIRNLVEKQVSAFENLGA